MNIKFKKLLKLALATFFCITIPISNIANAYERGNINYEKEDLTSNDKATPSDGIAADLPEPPYTTSAASIVMDAETGQILYENNAYDKLYPASITKVLTALVALENGDYDSTITMSESAVFGIEEGSCNIALDVGEKISFEAAMYAMLLESANEASLAIAEQVSGTLEQFCTTMNQRAKELGCLNTHFTNSNGLHDENHYTTAYDMALITREAIKNKKFIEITSAMSYTIPATNKNSERTLNKETRMCLEWSDYYYPYCIGGKTGYTDQAGGTLVTWSEKNGMKLICVDMYTPSNAENYVNSTALLDYCFDNFEALNPFSGFSFSEDHKAQAVSCLDEYYGGEGEGTIELVADTSQNIYLPKDYKKSKLVTKINFNATDADKGEIGRLSVEYNNEECISIPIKYSGYIPDNASSDQISSDASKVEDVIADSDNNTKKKKHFNAATIIIILLLGAGIGLYLRVIYVRKQRELYRQKRNEMRNNNRF